MDRIRDHQRSRRGEDESVVARSDSRLQQVERPAHVDIDKGARVIVRDVRLVESRGMDNRFDSEKPAEPSGRPGKEDAHYKFLGVNAMANFERYQVESSLSFTCRFRLRLGVRETAAMPSAAAKANTRAIFWSNAPRQSSWRAVVRAVTIISVNHRIANLYCLILAVSPP